MIRVVPVCAASFGANTYLLISGCHALVVDPAVSVSAILEAIRAEDAYPEGILLTHGHFDHILSLDNLRDNVSIPASIHQEDAIMLTDGTKNAFYELFKKERVYRPAQTLLSDGDEIALGEDTIRVLHTPGHTPGSVCYLCGDALITGDTLFADNIGRCDLWGGSDVQMASSLEHLRTLDKSLRIYPGHGNSETLGRALDNAAYFL